MNTYNILVIGDLHGKSDWLSLIQKQTLPIHKVVFLGDYVDSYDITIEKQIDNLINIINFKSKNIETVELLLGNHDIQYVLPMNMLNKVRCTGFKSEAYYSFHLLFNEFKNFFSLAYQYKNYLFTHAGIHRGWYNFRFKMFHNNETLAAALNREFICNNDVLYDCGYIRGGSKKMGGPLWADFIETHKKPLTGYHQIVGHTRRDTIRTYTKNTDTSVTYCDVLDLKQECFILKIEGDFLWEKTIQPSSFVG